MNIYHLYEVEDMRAFNRHKSTIYLQNVQIKAKTLQAVKQFMAMARVHKGTFLVITDKNGRVLAEHTTIGGWKDA